MEKIQRAVIQLHLNYEPERTKQASNHWIDFQKAKKSKNPSMEGS